MTKHFIGNEKIASLILASGTFDREKYNLVQKHLYLNIIALDVESLLRELSKDVNFVVFLLSLINTKHLVTSGLVLTIFYIL